LKHNRGVRQAAYFDIILEDTTLDVPGDFPTIQEALDSLSMMYIPPGVTCTIKVAAGVYTQTERIIANHPHGRQIRIEGAEPIPYTVTGFSGATATTFGFNLSSVTGLAAGDVVILPEIVGVGNVFPLHGAYRVASIAGNTVHVSHSFRMLVAGLSIPTINAGTKFFKMATVIRCNGCHGLQVSNDTTLGELRDIAFLGDGSSGGDIGDYSAILMWRRTALNLFGYVAGIGFSGDGLRIGGVGAFCFCSRALFCNNGGCGIRVSEGAAIHSQHQYLVCNHNAEYGILAEGLAPGCYIHHAIACGNGKNGILVRGCDGVFEHAIVSFNAEWGMAVANGGGIKCTNSHGIENGWAEFHAWGNSTMIAPGTSGRYTPAPDTISVNGSVILLQALQG
jgi:hypothetical protein